MFTEMGKI